MTFENDKKTLNGTDPVTALVTLQSLGADAVGCNCSTGPEIMADFVGIMKPFSKVPLIAKPNAGMPILKDGETVFSMLPREFALHGKKLVLMGANMVGGCCGTTPGHIKEMTKHKALKPLRPVRGSISAVSSARHAVILEKDRSLVVVGECINPTGKKALQKELREGKLSLVRELAKDQERHGAELLDVNAGMPGIDEKKTMESIIRLLSVNSVLPLVIDSTDPDIIESALRLYPGRALINSISAEKAKMKKLLNIASHYGAMFILLPLTGKKIAKTAGERRKIIEDVYKEAKRFGFTKDDFVVDGLAMAVSSDPASCLETMKTISWCSKEFGVNTILGVSNISFGMPQRTWLNSSCFAMMTAHGLSMVLSNPMVKEFMNVKRSCDVLLSRDKDASRFISHFSTITGDKAEVSKKDVPLAADKKVFNAILEGNREGIQEMVKEARKSGMPADDIVHKVMIPAINKVGDLFDKKEFFLPQLIASAEAMKMAFAYLEPYLDKGKESSEKKTVIFLATVKGDIHDIGKNIVALMLKNHGFSVVDLGKDVASTKIIKAIKEQKDPIVGLSALMTTTMVNMKEVIDLTRKEGINCRFLLGGAVVTRAYAESLGAEYAGDGVEAVRVVKKIIS